MQTCWLLPPDTGCTTPSPPRPACHTDKHPLLSRPRSAVCARRTPCTRSTS
jgi:hypothetical protein